MTWRRKADLESAPKALNHGDHKIVIPYEWIGRRGEPVLAGWELEPRQRRQLKALLIQLELVDYELAVGTLIFKKGSSGIYYSKINGNVALRPRCCVGPELDSEELKALNDGRYGAKESFLSPAGRAEVVTYLEQVDKKDGKERPSMKDSRAPGRLAALRESRRLRQRVVLHKGGSL